MITLLPELRPGRARPSVQAIEQWVIAAWLLVAEGRAYVEDLHGGSEQPAMQQAAKLRLLEVLSDVDQRLAGRVAAADTHCLALALEYGFDHLMDISGPTLIELFSLTEEFGGDACDVAAVLALWPRLLEMFPGELPDRLVAQGQRDMLVTLRTWATLCRRFGLDVGLLEPYLKDA